MTSILILFLFVLLFCGVVWSDHRVRKKTPPPYEPPTCKPHPQLVGGPCRTTPASSGYARRKRDDDECNDQTMAAIIAASPHD
jgi:hypothetical protein